MYNERSQKESWLEPLMDGSATAGVPGRSPSDAHQQRGYCVPHLQRLRPTGLHRHLSICLK